MKKALKRKIYLILTACLMLGLFLPAINNSLAQSVIEFMNIEVENIDGKTVKIRWTTNVATKGKVIFGLSGTNMPYFLESTRPASRYHDMTLGNLTPKANYYFKIIATNEQEETQSFVQKFETTDYNNDLPPKINNFRVNYISGTKAVVTWETDEKASSIVEFDNEKTYRLKAANYRQELSHSVTLHNLSPDTHYYIKIYSIDKDKNQSGIFYKEFTTLPNDRIDKENLSIAHFKPSSPGDSNIFSDSIIISFTTNHYAKGRVTLYGSGIRSKSINLDYNTNHRAVFGGLSSGKEYTANLYMTDIFNKRETLRDIKIRTKEVGQTAGEVNVLGISFASLDELTDKTCSEQINSYRGYYGQYFNLPENINSFGSNGIAEDTGWYASQYFSFARIDNNVDFGRDFFPLDEGLTGDPYYFSVYWRAAMEVPFDGIYNYQITSDDDSWLFIDRKLFSDLDGLHITPAKDSRKINLAGGWHTLEVYFAERKPINSIFSLTIDSRIKIHPLPPECSISSTGQVSGSGAGRSGTIIGSGSGDENVIVKGAEFSLYTPATALLKTSNSPDVYAVMNGQRHYISSPASFNEYGFRWNDIKIVSWAELSKYPRARLIKSSGSPTIHHLYQRPENLWLKIDIPSPTAFVSYPGNFWGNVITVTQLDVDAYPKVKIIKTAEDSALYFLENSTKRFVSAEVFAAKNFRTVEIAEVSKIHLETYKTGDPLK